jgi:hypothetical protein
MLVCYPIMIIKNLKSMRSYNTILNLMVDKPYADGGVEHSGRIAKPGDEFRQLDLRNIFWLPFT